MNSQNTSSTPDFKKTTSTQEPSSVSQSPVSDSAEKSSDQTINTQNHTSESPSMDNTTSSHSKKSTEDKSSFESIASDAPQKNALDDAKKAAPNDLPPPPHSSPSSMVSGTLAKWAMGIAVIAILLSFALLVGLYRLNQQYGTKPQWHTQWQKDRQTLEESLQSKSSQWGIASKSLNNQIQSLQKTITQEQKKRKETVSALISPMLTALNDDVDVELSAMEKKLVELEQHQEFLERRQIGMQTLIAELPSQRVLWQLIEVVQLQRQALRRLQVDKDIPTALASLKIALEVLRTLDLGDNANYLQQTKQTIVSLREQNTPSASELDYQISTLSHELATLSPLLHSESALLSDMDAARYQAIDETLPSSSPVQPNLPWYRQLWLDTMFEVNNAFRFYPEDRPLVPPEGDYFLRQNMNLSLLIIRSAALRHDERVFDTELLRLQEWVQRFFEDNEALQTVKKRMSSLQKQTLEVDSKQMKQLVRQGEAQLAILEKRLRIGERP